MRLFWELALRAFRRQITYRAATFAGLMTNLFFGMLRAAVIVALYAGRAEVAGLTLQSAVTYTGLTQAIIGFLSFFGWYDLISSVHDGSIGAHLLKPMSMFRLWLALDLGKALNQALLRGLPIMFVYALMFKLTYPRSLTQWLVVLVTLILAWLVSFTIRFIINLSAFWVPNSSGIARFAFGAYWFLSGFLMPLRLMPDWFADFCYLTPFPYALTIPVEAYLGVLQGPALMKALALQSAWFLFLFLLAEFILRRGIHRLTIAGG